MPIISAPVFQVNPLKKTISTQTAVCGAVLLALVLSFTNIDARSLWLDEAFSVGVTALDWPDLSAALVNREANMGLYFTLLKLWVGIMGSGESAVRSLSALLASATVPIIYLLGCRLFNSRVGITAAWLLAVNPFFIRYAQEARAYSLVLFLVSIASYSFLRVIDEPSRKNRAMYICASALAAYAHFFALLIPACHAASLLTMKQKTGRLRDSMLTFSMIGILVLPLIRFILTKDSGQVDWVQPVDLLSLPRLFFAFSGLVDVPLVVAYLLIFPIGLFMLFQLVRNHPDSQEKWLAGFTFIWLALPIAIVTLVSLLKPLFVTRYFIVSFPAFILITSLGLASITRTWLHRLCVAVTIVLSINAVLTSYRASTVADWKSTVSFLFASSLPDDALFVFNSSQIVPYSYYKGKYPGQRQPPNCLFPATPANNRYTVKLTPHPDRQQLSSLLANRTRTWLLICEDTPKRLLGFLSLFGTHLQTVRLSGDRAENHQGEELRVGIQAHYRYHRHWEFERIRLYLFSNET